MQEDFPLFKMLNFIISQTVLIHKNCLYERQQQNCSKHSQHRCLVLQLIRATGIQFPYKNTILTSIGQQLQFWSSNKSVVSVAALQEVLKLLGKATLISNVYLGQHH